MSVLIDELEARKNDYILVADVINVLGNATNSVPDEVVKYLDAHNIDDHMPLLYMDESYTFEEYNGHILGLGNDANITYYQKADVMAFEPIIKHGIFKEGSNDFLNPYQKNIDDDYLTLDEVMANLNNRAGLSCGYDKIRDLARKKKITPCFYFSGFVCPLFKGPLGELYISNSTNSNSKFKMMTGYFTYRLLVEQISNQDDYLTVPSCEVGNEIRIHRLLERQDDTNINYSNGLALFESKPQPFDDHKNNRSKFSCIGFDEIRFSKQELDSYIASLDTVYVGYKPTAQDSELLTKLETAQAENSDLNARLFTARNTYKQDKNEIKELKAQLEKVNIEKANLIEQLNKAKADLADKSADDKELAPNSQAKVTHMLYAILKEHRYDLSSPKGKGVANDQIVAASRSHKSPVTRNFVANWLERVHQLDIDLKK
ncbi:coiled-coil domain-containing protein [Psychrobacter sp. K31L]|uniref:coiled-coil domain-containing protein n=1 Tax=Psychrobacter sp. K31L TaxID=2820758 RepID=UPI001B32A98A|nr:hypothetical protein [Psychrobacter sp. K31L]MBP3946048.1 hypothetical protein [Psychrobacter sp. K31L]